jgi:pimeloyl-ACP methyl ester carboxylesterase
VARNDLFALERAVGGGASGLVVTVHGTMDRHSSFGGVRRQLPEVATLVYDRRGYGRSRHLSLATGLDDHVEDLLGLCAGRPVVVVGHSYGGCIGLRAAEVAPQVVRAVVVFEPPLPWLDGWPSDTGTSRALAAPDPPAGVEAYLRHVLGDERWDALTERARADRRGEGPALLADLRSVRPEPGHPPPLDLGAIAVPVVIGRGTRSAAYLQAGANRLVGLLAQAELHVLEGAGHGAHNEQPAQIASLARRAMERARG